MDSDTQASPPVWAASLAPNTLFDPFAPTEAVIDSYPPLFAAEMAAPGMEGARMWVATRFEPIREIFQNGERYSSHGVYPYFRAMNIDLTAIPIDVDPPEHTRYRKFLEPSFSPRAMVALEPLIRANIDKLIDSFIDKGQCDISYDYSRIYPVRVFMELMGFPEERFDDFLSWSHPMHFETDNFERYSWGTKSALAFMQGFINEVRSRPPDDTVASRIVHGECEGSKLTDKEVLGTIFFLWDGGMDTVAATSSLMFRRLALDPDLQQLLRDNPDRMANAVEEFLRMHPTVNTVRIALVDHELEGQQIKAGDRLMCMVAAGNFDPDKYEDPRSFRLDRSQNHHFTFVAGPHRCLGINLARFELRLALSEILRRIPDFRIKPGVDCMAVPGLMGAPNVPIVWDTGAS
ncbi:MAG: cytochrome P450 [Novosphingobium sp.]|nr:cytochrome P450 [Novosphingobium sp.]